MIKKNKKADKLDNLKSISLKQKVDPKTQKLIPDCKKRDQTIKKRNS